MTELNNGVHMPLIGLGTAFGTKARALSADVESLVYKAIELGYRHFDCARCYMTEDQVGNAIARQIAENNVKRGDIFITSKLFGSYHQADQVESCLQQSLQSLKTDFVDLYLVHSPCAINAHRKRDENGMFYPDNEVDYVETWRQFEKLYRKGVVKAIGVSNFNCHQLDRLLRECVVKPAVNQIESHPYFNNDDLIRFCNKNDIHVTAYSPFGSDGREPLIDGAVQEIASKRGISPAQVCLRFSLQRGLSVVPRTQSLSHLSSNLSAGEDSGENLVLSEKQMSELTTLSRPSGRRIALKEFSNCKDYPFDEEDPSSASKVELSREGTKKAPISDGMNKRSSLLRFLP